MISTRTAAFALAYGLLIWFEATIMIRWFGYLVFVPDDLGHVAALFGLTPLVVFAVGWFFFASFQTPPGARAAATILICASGLVANAAVINWIDLAYPDMSEVQHRLFSSWVVWAYGVGLMSGIWPRVLVRVPTD